MYLIEKAYATGYLMLQEGNQKYGNVVRRAMMLLTTLLAFGSNQGVLAQAGGASSVNNERLTETVKMVLGMVYVIMVVVGVFLLVTNIMAYATADADNGPARTKATYGIAGGALLVLLPAILTAFPFAKWVADQVTNFSGGNGTQQ